MPQSKFAPKRRITTKSGYLAKRRRTQKMIGRRRPVPRGMARVAATNCASVKEAYTASVPDGTVLYGRTFQLANPEFDRAQTVAQAYQEFRVKYIKMTFRPAADTFSPVPGNSIPTLYYIIDKTNSVPTTANAGTFFSLGCKPHRMDDKQIEVVWKPAVLVSTATAAGVAQASEYSERPWLSTNANAFNPAAAWAPSTVDHLGIVLYVTKINAADSINYNIDFEVEFEFRKPNWRMEANEAPLPGFSLKGKDLVAIEHP